MRDLPHPFRAKCGNTPSRHITAALADLPEVNAQTATRVPLGTLGVVKMPSFNVRDALWRGPSPEKPCPSGNPSRTRKPKLLDLHLGAGLFELLLDRRGFVLVHAFLDGLGRAVHQVLGFLQAQAGDFANRLDDVNLVSTN